MPNLWHISYSSVFFHERGLSNSMVSREKYRWTDFFKLFSYIFTLDFLCVILQLWAESKSLERVCVVTIRSGKSVLQVFQLLGFDASIINITLAIRDLQIVKFLDFTSLVQIIHTPTHLCRFANKNIWEKSKKLERVLIGYISQKTFRGPRTPHFADSDLSNFSDNN